jgi:hypothetical protein
LYSNFSCFLIPLPDCFFREVGFAVHLF